MGAHSNGAGWRLLNRPVKAKGLVAVAATVLGMFVLPLATASTASAASSDPVVTLESGTSGCNGVRPTPGSENTNKRLVSGDLEPGGTVTFEISYPVDPTDVGQDFAITDCVFINDVAALKYTVAFVPNNVNFLLTFQLTIPVGTPIGAEYCNDAKTTQSPSSSPASNRKAGPACFHVGGDLRIIKEAAGDTSHTPLAGASFTVSCPTNVTIPPVVISGLSGSTTYSGGAYQASGTADTGIIAIAGPEGTPCTVTETAPPAGYDLPATTTFDYKIPAATAGQETDYIDDPVSKKTTTLVTSAASGTVGGVINDTATLSGASADAGGSITFNAYGPSDTANCAGTAVYTTTVTVTGPGSYGSGDFTPDTAGSYYWTASYTGDAKNLPSDEKCGADGETSTVGKKTTLIATAASTGTVGDAIHDTATLSGTTANAGGTITFNLYGPSDNPDCSGTPIFTDTANVSGSGDYLSGAFAPDTAGLYYWTASYSGDANNLPSSETCGATGETSTVGKKTTLIGTVASSATAGTAIHDTATLSGATANAGGTITFNAYGPSDTADCSGTAVFTDTVSVSGPGDYVSGDYTTSVAGKYWWTASYSGDDNNLPSSDACGADGETSSVGPHPSTLTTTASSGTVGDAIHDTAHLSDALSPTGTITFNLYGPSDTPDCTGIVIYTNTVTVSGNGDYGSGNFTPSAAGSYYWTASYSGDGNNSSSSETCGADGETSTLGKHRSALTTTASSGTVGDAVHDTAHLTGALSPTGTITFDLYGPSAAPDCSGAPIFSTTVSVNDNGDYTSDSFTPDSAGSYYWTASYSGDANNSPSSETCGADGETSVLGKHGSTLTTTASSGTVGDAVHDTAHLTGALSPTGTITFNLYGPSAAPDCSGTAVYSNTVTVNDNGDYGSGDFTPSTAGSYYWTASYSGDANNSPSGEACGADGETSTLAKHGATLTTTAGSATLGSSINDTAHLAGALSPTGTISFHLYGNATCTGDALFSNSVDVNGNGDYVSGSYTPSTAGSYYWTAHYSGDTNNSPVDEPCGSANETSTISQHVTGLVTTAAGATIGSPVSDAATLSGGVAPTGTITFNLYGPSSTASCTGTPVFTSTVTVSGNGSYASGPFAPTSAGSYYWTASYSGDANNLPSSEPCGADNETSVVNQAATTLTTLATSGTVGQPIHDTATLTGATADAGGTITFTVYGPDDTTCGGTPAFTSDPVAVHGSGAYLSGDFTPSLPGNYYWTAHYSGDVNNLPSDEACGAAGETSGLGVAGTSASSPPPTSPSHSVAGQPPVAVTGSPVGEQIAWAIALLAAGAGFVLLGLRRRRRAH